MNILDIKTLGGSLRFFGEWFGRPYDNYHKIEQVTFEDNILTLYFDKGEVLTVKEPTNISNNENSLIIFNAKEVIWEYTPYGTTINKKIVYINYANKRIIKRIDINEKIIPFENQIAVECLSY